MGLRKFILFFFNYLVPCAYILWCLIKYELGLRLFLKSGNPKCHFSVWDSLMSPPGIGQHILRNDVNEQCFMEDTGKVWLSSILIEFTEVWSLWVAWHYVSFLSKDSFCPIWLMQSDVWQQATTKTETHQVLCLYGWVSFLCLEICTTEKKKFEL